MSLVSRRALQMSIRVEVRPILERAPAGGLIRRAIRDAATRPTMRFVPIKSVEQQMAGRAGPSHRQPSNPPSHLTKGVVLTQEQ